MCQISKTFQCDSKRKLLHCARQKSSRLKRKRGRGLQHSCWMCKKSHCNATNYSFAQKWSFCHHQPCNKLAMAKTTTVIFYLYVARMNRYFFYRKKRLFRNIRWVPIPFDVRWLNLPLLGLSFLLANQLDLNSIMRLNRRPLSSSSTESLVTLRNKDTKAVTGWQYLFQKVHLCS